MSDLTCIVMATTLRLDASPEDCCARIAGSTSLFVRLSGEGLGDRAWLARCDCRAEVVARRLPHRGLLVQLSGEVSVTTSARLLSILAEYAEPAAGGG